MQYLKELMEQYNRTFGRNQGEEVVQQYYQQKLRVKSEMLKQKKQPSSFLYKKAPPTIGANDFVNRSLNNSLMEASERVTSEQRWQSQKSTMVAPEIIRIVPGKESGAHVGFEKDVDCHQSNYPRSKRRSFRKKLLKNLYASQQEENRLGYLKTEKDKWEDNRQRQEAAL